MLKKFRTIFNHEVIINLDTVVTAKECFPDDDDDDEIFVKVKLITGDIVEIVGTLDDLII